MNPTNPKHSKTRQTLRVLRPLFWWMILVLVLYGIRTHQRLMEKTRLRFNVALEGQTALANALASPAARLDANSVFSGDRISLGRHTFSINAGNKWERFSTNLFIWYGGQDFGTIKLKRTKGTLSIHSTPAARRIVIHGPQFNTAFTKSSGTNLVVPTDRYAVEAQFLYSTETAKAMVTENLPESVNFAPRFGAIHITSSHSNTTYRLTGENSSVRLNGELPATIDELPVGEYEVTTERLGQQRMKKVLIAAGQTNDVLVEYKYGAVTLDTEPEGATVVDDTGRKRGETPLTLQEVPARTWRFSLRRDHFEPVSVQLEIAANETNVVRTNLVSQSYASAMKNARRLLENGNYDQAAEVLADALRAEPNDASATSLRHQAVGLSNISRAERFGRNGDYVAATKELEKALVELPDNARAKQLLAEFKQRETEQLARQERERIEAFTNVFEGFTGTIHGADKVEIHELTTSKSVKEVQSAIVEQFHSSAPSFRLSHIGWTNGVFYLYADQEVAGGGRLCMIVGAPIKQGETRIRFKVIEFKSEALGLRILGSVLGAATSSRISIKLSPNQSFRCASDGQRQEAHCRR